MRAFYKLNRDYDKMTLLYRTNGEGSSPSLFVFPLHTYQRERISGVALLNPIANLSTIGINGVSQKIKFSEFSRRTLSVYTTGMNASWKRFICQKENYTNPAWLR